MKNRNSKLTAFVLLLSLLGLIACADLTVTDLNAPSTANAGQWINVSSRIKNIGDEKSTATQYALYLSHDPYYDLKDHELGKWDVNEIAVGNASLQSRSVFIPTTTFTGQYYLVAMADPDNHVAEAETRHNNRAYRSIFINGASNNGPDLVPVNVFHPTATDGDNTFEVKMDIRNVGTANAGNTQIKYYFSQDENFDLNADVLLATRTVTATPVQTSNAINQSLNMPAGLLTAYYYLIIRVDPSNQVAEYNENNNEFLISMYVRQPKPDLNFSNFYADGEAKPGATITTTFYLRNTGFETAPTQTTAFYISESPVFDPNNNVRVGALQIGSLAGATTNALSHDIVIPPFLDEGNYYLHVYADDGKEVEESNENNNYRSIPICVHDGNPITDPNQEEFIELGSELISTQTLEKMKEERLEISAQVKAYPNPARDMLNLAYELSEHEKVDVVISDLSGRVLRSYRGLNGGSNIQQIDLTNVPAGTYIVHVKSGEEFYVEKVVVK